MIDENDGFHLVYAKKGGIPKNCFFETRVEVTGFLLNNLNEIDFICINDMIINKDKLVNDNIKLGRYLKIDKINKSI
jgi:hypothetical protein